MKLRLWKQLRLHYRKLPHLSTRFLQLRDSGLYGTRCLPLAENVLFQIQLWRSRCDSGNPRKSCPHRLQSLPASLFSREHSKRTVPRHHRNGSTYRQKQIAQYVHFQDSKRSRHSQYSQYSQYYPFPASSRTSLPCDASGEQIDHECDDEQDQAGGNQRGNAERISFGILRGDVGGDGLAFRSLQPVP